MTPRILELLVREYAGLSKQVVIGKGFRNTHLIEAAADSNTVLNYYPDDYAMRDIMLASDIAISAGGQTLYELARAGVPSVVVAVADNQMNNVGGWQEAGFIKYAGWWEDSMILDNVLNELGLCEDHDMRNKMSKAGSTLVDGAGAKRIVEYICSKESICGTL
jgi:spore coat polysaccharide biosynthesis predicted glycosyltransferase SpsG